MRVVGDHGSGPSVCARELVCVWVKQENEYKSATLHEFIEKIITSHVRRLAHPHQRARCEHHRHHNRHLLPYQFLGAQLALINLWILIRTERLIKVVGHQLIVHFNESDYPLWLITPSRDRLCATRDRRLILAALFLGRVAFREDDANAKKHSSREIN